MAPTEESMAGSGGSWVAAFRKSDVMEESGHWVSSYGPRNTVSCQQEMNR